MCSAVKDALAIFLKKSLETSESLSNVYLLTTRSITLMGFSVSNLLIISSALK